MSAALARGRPASSPETLLLARRDVAALMDQAAWLEAVETGFRAAAEGRAEAPPPMTLHGHGGAFHAKGASLRIGRHFAAVKLNANFPDNPDLRNLPTIQGALLLCDGETGALLAIMDSIEITLRRTAAATALAARYLARPDSRTILICGCGAQGRAQLAALREILPLDRALLWDRGPGRASDFAAALGGEGFAAESVAGTRGRGRAQRRHRDLHHGTRSVSRGALRGAGNVRRRGRRGQPGQERDRARSDGRFAGRCGRAGSMRRHGRPAPRDPVRAR